MNLLEVCAQYEKYAVYDETHHWGGVEGYFKQRAKEILSMLHGKMLEGNKLPLLEGALISAFELGQSKGLGKTATHYNSDGSIDNTICTKGTPNQTCRCDKCNKEFMDAKPEFHEYRGFTIKVFWDYKDEEWIAEKSRKSEKEGYMPSSGPSKDIAITRAKEGIDKVHKAISHGDR